MPKKSEKWSSTGRRKSSVARVQMTRGKGDFTINNRPIENYFGRDTLKMVLKQPMDIIQLDQKYDISVNVVGGGLSGQAGAIRLGIARCIQKMNPDNRLLLKLLLASSLSLFLHVPLTKIGNPGRLTM